jgi:hypothetical protein
MCRFPCNPAAPRERSAARRSGQSPVPTGGRGRAGRAEDAGTAHHTLERGDAAPPAVARFAHSPNSVSDMSARKRLGIAAVCEGGGGGVGGEGPRGPRGGLNRSRCRGYAGPVPSQPFSDHFDFDVPVGPDEGNRAYFGRDVLTGLVEGIAHFVHERQLRASLRSGQAGTERRCPPQDSLGRSSR